MNDNASPGPDGFGPAFFKSNWTLVKDDLFNLLADFDAYSADLRRFNKAYIVLLPKKIGANHPENYRPVSLQNCAVKIVSKCLANRAHCLMSNLIHHGQTGFIRERGIAENFLLAADLVQTCFKRKSPSIVLKLDFHKAFDSVSWDALAVVMCAKGFPSLWGNWINLLNFSSTSASC